MPRPLRQTQPPRHRRTPLGRPGRHRLDRTRRLSRWAYRKSRDRYRKRREATRRLRQTRDSVAHGNGLYVIYRADGTVVRTPDIREARRHYRRHNGGRVPEPPRVPDKAAPLRTAMDAAAARARIWAPAGAGAGAPPRRATGDRRPAEAAADDLRHLIPGARRSAGAVASTRVRSSGMSTTRGRFQVIVAAYDEVAFDPDAQLTLEDRAAAMGNTSYLLGALAHYHAEHVEAVYATLPNHLRHRLRREVEEHLRAAAQTWATVARAYEQWAEQQAAELNKVYGADVVAAANGRH